MSVRAKFKVTTKDPGESGAVGLEPVISGSPENESFYSYTPAGSISLSTVNPEAFKQFEVGKEFYVDFTIAE